MSGTVQAQTRFADYFVVCGLDISSGLEPDQLSGDHLHYRPLQRCYKSKVLSHYPQNVDWNRFDKDAVGMLCMPKGLSFRTEKDNREPKFHSFLITREDGSRTYGSALTFYEEVHCKQICLAMQSLQTMYQAEFSNRGINVTRINEFAAEHDAPRPTFSTISNYDMNKDCLYVTKCICVITQQQFVRASRKFLTQLYDAVAANENPPLPMESYIHNVLYEVPLPPVGRSMRFNGVRSPVLCQRPGTLELPLCDFSFRELFTLLDVENLVQLFTCALLENQILLFSTDYQRLMLVAECLSTLLFPFTWQHVYVPILPASMLHFLDAPVPYVMGLHSSGGQDRSQLNLPNEASLCFVDIDNHIVEVPEELPQFPYKSEFILEISQVLDRFKVSVDRDQDLGFHEPDSNSNSRQGSSYDLYGLQESLNVINASMQKDDSYDNESPKSGSAVSSRRGSQTSLSTVPNKSEFLRNNEIVSKVAAIAKRTGVIKSISDVEEAPKKADNEKDSVYKYSKLSREDIDELTFNSAVREVFCYRFVQMFRNYESFVIQPNQEMEAWINAREQMQNFDKAAFLSDQPDAAIPFLSPFIESQMFATFIDWKIMGNWEEMDNNLRVFEARIDNYKTKNTDPTGSVKTPNYEHAISVNDYEHLIIRRATTVDHIAVSPHLLSTNIKRKHEPGVFPELNAEALVKPVTSHSPSRAKSKAQWRRKDRQHQHAEHLQLKQDQREKYIQEARGKSIRAPQLLDMSPGVMAQTNWKFVEGLLKECRVKTKRMLVEKMGQEAVELGHGEVKLTGVEENTLIASLCDLLERIWSHGLQMKQGKSAFWSHLLAYKEMKARKDSTSSPNFLVPIKPSTNIPLDWLRGVFKFKLFYFVKDLNPDSPQSGHRRRGSGLPDPVLPPVPTDLASDIVKVESMTDVKTDVGYARAWIRLALERKLLCKHLKELLSDYELCRSRYKRYAFLRSDDEKEQFLYYLLSLNAVDYHCFTNSFISTKITYKVLVFVSKKFNSATSANPWISIAGELGDTGIIQIPKSAVELTFEHRNLGVLTTVRIGHDNSGMSPKWMLDYILVRNELTAHTYKFPCGRWLGKGVDDGSLERLLVGEVIPSTTDTEDILNACRTPPNQRSPVQVRRHSPMKNTGPQVQEMITDAVNHIVKYFYKPEKERGSLTLLLCGDKGLVQCLDQVFQYGFKSSRLFRNNFFIWDFIEKVSTYFDSVDHDDEGRRSPPDQRQARRMFCGYVKKINNSSQNIGKDGKFQLLMCLGVRDHVLQVWFPQIAATPVTVSMYEEWAMMRDRSSITFLVQIINALREFNIMLEASLTKGLEV
ncbi:DENN domain-containing protein 5B-like isoform X2 [Ptychodera flava]|uniref:DENN domain-containing protein 5B-like isoform X2 n=1 Tax=Ptychodera flava TaxID=63121 RepID=UPI003969F470